MPPDRGGGNSRIPNDIAILGVDNDETICKLSAPNLSSLSQGVEQGGYDVARLIDRLIRNPEAEWEDVMVMPLNIITRQSTDIYANNDPHIAEVLRYIHENISQKITVDDLVKLVPLSRRLLETRFKKSMGTSIYDYIIQTLWLQLHHKIFHSRAFKLEHSFCLTLSHKPQYIRIIIVLSLIHI